MVKDMLRFVFPVIVFFLTACNDGSTKKTEKERPPNIVLVFTDDQGYQDVGVFGAKDILTPNLDQLAADGVRLTNFYAAQAVCSASRAALLTGCYPNRIGIHQALMPHSPIGLHPRETTMAELLKQKGYKTAIYGKWHLGDHPDFLPTKHGFDEWFGIPYSNDMWPQHPMQDIIFDFDPLPLYENEKIIDTLTDQSSLTTAITERSVDFIQRNKDTPFFLYVPHPQPHVPLAVSDTFKGKSKRGLYGDVIMEIDWSLGSIVEALKNNGLEDNTLVIFTSDNGPWLSYGNHAGSAYPLREGKGTAWEGGQREPFIAKYPKELPKGAAINTPIMAIDLLPTIARIATAQLPEMVIDGKDVWDILKGTASESPHEAYYFYYNVNELHAIRQGDWKLYFPHRYRSMKGQAPGNDGTPGEYAYFDLKDVELYHLAHDIGETVNVAPQHPDIVQQLTALADDMRTRLGDSLLETDGTETREPGRSNE